MFWNIFGIGISISHLKPPLPNISGKLWVNRLTMCIAYPADNLDDAGRSFHEDGDDGIGSAGCRTGSEECHVVLVFSSSLKNTVFLALLIIKFWLLRIDDATWPAFRQRLHGRVHPGISLATRRPSTNVDLQMRIASTTRFLFLAKKTIIYVSHKKKSLIIWQRKLL